jgi:hypothetical protein
MSSESIKRIIEAIEAIELLYESKRQIVGLSFLRETIMPKHVQFLIQSQKDSGQDYDFSSIKSFALRQLFMNSVLNK